MKKKYVIAISFANYLKDKTGISKVIMGHQQMYNQNNVSYVALFSVKKNLCHDRIMLFCKYGLIIDGEFKGVFQMNQIIHMMAIWQENGRALLDIHLHHLMYTKISLISELLQACPNTPIKSYLHDYYNACTGYNLLKNGDFYCGGKGFSEDYCGDCVFAKKNKEVQNRIHQLFTNNIQRITFISPSEATKTIFLNFHPEYSNKIVVIPHQKYDKHYIDNLEPINQGDKIEVAFLGMPARHKGWLVWQKLVSVAIHDKYEFTVFNSSDDIYPQMGKVKIGFSKDNLNAMTDALRKHKAHVVLLWSMCPETYSYTCFEAYSANAFIITNSSSGNIADVVKANNNGIVLSDEEELYTLFETPDKLRNMINAFRKNTSGGPDVLYENDYILQLTLKNNQKPIVRDKFKIINYPLLWALNILLKR